MSIQDWGALGEIVGGIGVVVTLIYLAIQIRENSRQMRVNSLISINQLINEGWDPIYSNDRNIRVWNTGLRSPTDLEEEDLALFHLFMTRLINVLSTSFSQHRHNVLPTDEFRKYAIRANSLLLSPGGEHWLSAGGTEILTNDAREAFAKYGTVRLSGFSTRQEVN
ncbi:MAG: hypothetical protein ACI9ON_002425 [Limisphaerales bacterium]